MTSFQTVFASFCLFQVAVTLARYRKSRRLANIGFAAAWCTALVLLVNPDLSSSVARSIGIGRGVDLIFYVLGFVFLWAHYRHYTMALRLERAVTILVRERALDQARAVDAIRLGQTTTRPVPTDTRTNSPPAFASDNDLESEVAADILRTCAEVRAAAQNETTASDQEASSEPLTPPLGDSMSWATTFTPTSNHSS
ncbi:MAG: DUF2304 domain-containing protein [Planctomycetales bacterium]|nr:DUF2304 domain-containing protein [Planctomycetales bacterium]